MIDIDPSKDPSIWKEPHLAKKDFSPAPGDEPAEGSTPQKLSDEDRLEHGVWDEPALSGELAGGPPPGEPTYGKWLAERRAVTGIGRSCLVTFLLALGTGPFAVLGAFWGSGETLFSVSAVVVFGPIIEEVMKTALAMYVVEKKPFLFLGSWQIVLCGLAGALAFASIENLLYLHVYIPGASQGLVRWRWTVCVALHISCTLIASLGLVRVWRDLWKRLARPQVSLVYPYLVAAVIVHGAYNAFALVLSAAQYQF